MSDIIKPTKVHYVCDSEGDHKATLADCITNKTKTFISHSEMIKFIDECTQIINLDEVLGVLPLDKLSEHDKQLLDSFES